MKSITLLRTLESIMFLTYLLHYQSSGGSTHMSSPEGNNEEGRLKIVRVKILYFLVLDTAYQGVC